MATLVRQMYRHHSLLNGTKQLGRQSIKTWTYSLEQLDVPLLSPYRKCFQPVLKKLFVKHIKFCSSSAEPTQRPENKSLSFADKLKSEDHYFNIEEDYPSGISRLTKALPEEKTALENLEEEDWEEDLSSSALEEVSEEEAIRILATPPLPSESFTLKDYVDHSETLRQLVLLGVDLSKVEKRRGAGQLLLKLDFEKDIKKTLLFLKDVGLKDDQLGAFLTKNPYIFREDVEDLQTRITYLTAKNFSKEEIAQMVARAPYLLLFSVERLDNRLGFFQKELGLNTQKTRDLVIRLPRILTGGLENIKENLKVFELELGFNRNEIRHILYKVPRNLDARKRKLTTIFDYLHNTMGIPHKLFVHFPQVFNSRLLRFKERHMFLEFLGKAQYDPEQPNYVSLDKLASLPNNAFCADIAKVKLEDFQKFLKTL